MTKRSSELISEVQQSLLKVNSLHVHYGKSEIIKGISFHVGDGEAVSLLGANGVGKTTLLRTVTGLKRCTSGEVIFAGKRIENERPHDIAAMGVAHVLQGNRVFPDLTVAENIEAGRYCLKPRRDIDNAKKEVLEFFPILGRRMRQKAGTLSGGERQMLVTARALISNPRLLIMDEPSAGLAPIAVNEIANVAVFLQKRGVSLLLVEQNTFLAFKATSRSYVLESGCVALEGKNEELLKEDSVRKVYLGI